MRFDDRIVGYREFELDCLGYAYALTVHKFQGSEARVVIMPITTSHYVMLSRNLIYTAVTRARETFVFVGTKKALYIAIRNNTPVKRYGGLGTFQSPPLKE